MRRSKSSTSDDRIERNPNDLRPGTGWIVGDHQFAAADTSECVLGIGAGTDDDVNQIVERARRAGATVASEPAPQPWGHAVAFTDPDGHMWTVSSAKLPG